MAKERGCEVVLGTDRTLQLDLDDKAALDRYQHIYNQIQKHFPDLIQSKEEWASMSGVGRHVVLRLSLALDIHQRIALQSLLGSDPIRELLSYRRALAGVPNETVLFRPLAASKDTTKRGPDDDLPF